MWTWDLGLGVISLNYFNIVVNLCNWDLGSLDYFNNGFSTHKWDPGSWFYIFKQIIEGNDFLRGMECCDPPYESNVGSKNHQRNNIEAIACKVYYVYYAC